jgi:hypothetical protein
VIQRIAFAVLAFAFLACGPRPAAAQYQYVGMQGTADVTPPALSAEVVPAGKNSALVRVLVKGVKLVDPDAAGGKPVSGQGHLHYILDDGPIIFTTAVKLGFHGLSSGKHLLTVLLAGNDHAPLGPTQTLTFVVP